MNINIDNLKKLIESIRSISLFQRLFSWGKIRQQLIDAVSDIQKMESSLEQINKENERISNELNLQTAKLDAANDIVSRYDGEKERLNYIIEDRGNRLTKIEKELSTFQNENENLKDALQKSSADFATLKQRFEWLEESFSKINQENTEFKAEEKNKREKYEQDVAGLNAIRDQIQNDRNKEQEERLIAETEKRNTLKETWSKHQTNVKSLIKYICQKHTIEYVDAVPFKGEPDNTIKICDEFVVFDAKSPGSDDLSNFPTYIKTQAESAKKYAKHENVKSDIFFVVPTNTLERLSQFVFNLADYNVFVISVDALEHIILSLKKI
jgi:archaellum component FlaC